jgi:hypothetical protein
MCVFILQRNIRIYPSRFQKRLDKLVNPLKPPAVDIWLRPDISKCLCPMKLQKRILTPARLICEASHR